MTKYYTLTNNTLTPLGLPVKIGGRMRYHPTADEAARIGAYSRGEDMTPDVPGGKIAVPENYEVRDGKWYRTYRLEDEPLPTIAEYDIIMEEHLRAEREARGYTSREPDVYLTSANVRWSQDARDWIAHRDDVMTYALELINAVSAGQREPPTIEEFRVGLPQITWSYQEDS